MSLIGINRRLNAVRHGLAGAGVRHGVSVFAAQSRAFQRATWLIRFYYVALLVLSAYDAAPWLTRTVFRQWDPLWPIYGLAHFIPSPLVGQGLALFVILATLSAAVAPRLRWTRVLAFLGIFLFVAYVNSFGKIGHSRFGWVLTSGMLIALPGWTRHPASPRRDRQTLLLVFGMTQALFLITYSMAGLGKLLAAAVQAMAGEAHAFSPTALSRHIAERLLQTGTSLPVGEWMIAHPGAGQVAMLLTLYLQTFALVAAFRPAWHRWWALGLMGFHLMSGLTMGIYFEPHMLLLAVLFLWSPFRPDRMEWKALPLAGDAWAAIGRWKRAKS